MNFFCTKKHLDQYVAEMNLREEGIFPLSAFEGLTVAQSLFSPQRG